MKNRNSQNPNQGQHQKQNSNQNIKFNTNKHRPENKDNLDSREGEENIFKGDDVTHNKKANKNK